MTKPGSAGSLASREWRSNHGQTNQRLRKADFAATVREACTWHKEHGWWEDGRHGIDTMSEPRIDEAFTRMGLAEFLHQ